MATIPLPALSIQPQLARPQYDMAQQLGQTVQLANAMRAAQYQAQLQPLQVEEAKQRLTQEQIQTQQMQQAQKDNQIIMDVWKQNGGDIFKTNDALTDAGVSPTGQMNFQQKMLQHREALAKVDKETLDANRAADAQLAPMAQAVVNAPPEDQTALYALTRNQIARDPTLSKYAAALPAQYPGADALNTFIAQHKTLQDLSSDRTFAAEHGAVSDAERQRFNAGVADRIRLLNPNLTSAPPEFQLPEGGTKDQQKMIETQVQQIEQAAQRLEAQRFRETIAGQRQSDVGTWSLQEDEKGNPILFNSKTAQTMPATGVQKPWTFQKVQGPINSYNYAKNYLDGKSYTGPGDEALMEKFFDLAKPETGFRMSAPQQKMLKDSQSIMGSIEGRARHLTTGTWFSDQQRKDIVNTMKQILDSNVKAGAQAAAQQPGGGGAAVQPTKRYNPNTGQIETIPSQ